MVEILVRVGGLFTMSSVRRKGAKIESFENMCPHRKYVI